MRYAQRPGFPGVPELAFAGINLMAGPAAGSILRLAAVALTALAGIALTAPSARAQVTCFGDPTCVQPVTGYPIGRPGTPNIEVVSHLPLPGVPFSHTDIEIEQDMSRPFVYIAQGYGSSGFYALSIEDPERPRVLYRWTIDNPDLHLGSGCKDIKYAKAEGRYYVIISCQFAQGGPDAELGAILFDVTGLPDGSTVRKVAELRLPDMPLGFHNIFAYRHSNGRSLLLATTNSEDAFIYDIAQLAAGVTDPVSAIAVPEASWVPAQPGAGGARPAGRMNQWHDMYTGYLPEAAQDRFYGAGAGGFHVFDMTDVENPRLLTSVTGIPGVENGHTFTPTPDGRYALGMPAPTYQHSPVRFFDLRPPGSEGQTPNIVRGSGIGAWIPKFGGATHNHEIRWPYVFISAQDDGLQIVNMADPTRPFTVGYYHTRQGPMLHDPLGRNPSQATTGYIYNGAWGVDIRNEDGLIVVSDQNSGFWAFRLEGFQGWNGNNWGMPNISSAQYWDDGPVRPEQIW